MDKEYVVVNDQTTIVNENGIYVAIGSDSKSIYSSGDAINWTKRITTPYLLFNLKYLGGQFIAVGEGSTIYNSYDGKTWRLRFDLLNGYGQDILDVAYGNGKFIASAPEGRVYLSYDGLDWGEYDTGLNDILSVIIYGGSYFYVRAVNSRKLFRSRDGLSWTEHADLTGMSIQTIEYVNSQFWGGGSSTGNFYVSPDGVNWTEKNVGTNANVRHFIYENDIYVIVAEGGKIFSSPDGEVWTQRAAGLVTTSQDINYAEGRFIINAGKDGIITSPDGIDWTRYSFLQNINLLYMKYGISKPDSGSSSNGIFIAVGEGNKSIWSSTGGRSWTERETFDRNIFSLKFAGGLFFALGEYSSIYSSPDGKTWTLRYEQQPGYWEDVVDVDYGNGIYVACSALGVIYVSSDGINWRETYISGHYCRNVLFANGKFYLLAEHTGQLYSSTNGITWTFESKLPGSGWLRYENGIFWLGGGNGIYYYSTSISSGWQQRMFTNLNVSFYNIFYTGFNYVLVTTNGNVYVSNNPGGSWQMEIWNTGSIRGSLGYGKGRFVSSQQSRISADISTTHTVTATT